MTEEEKKERQKEINRKAVKKYTEKVKPIQFTIQYKAADKPDGERLREYLTQTGQSAQAYIKQLIKQDMDRRGIHYPSGNPADNPMPIPDGIDDNNDRLPWESDDHSSHATNGNGSAWDVLEQIARENGYKG